MRARLGTGVVAGFAALLLAASQPTQSGVITAVPPTDRLPVWSHDGTNIAFVTNRDAEASGRELELLENSYGQALHIVTRAGKEHRAALLQRLDALAISPSWRSLAVVGYAERKYALFVMNLDGGERRSLADAHPLEPPSWAPDGDRIAFVGVDLNVRTIRADGSGLRSLGEGAAPVWSPDASKIAFRSLNPPGIGVVSVDGGRREIIATGQATGLAWSPDGNRIAFHAGLGKISVVELSTRRRHDFAVTAQSNRPPAWSPGGDRIAFVVVVPKKSRIAVVDVDGGEPRSVTTAPAASDVTWSPDGTEIAYSDLGRCGRLGIHVANVATGKSVRLTNDCGIFGTPRGDHIVGTALVDVIDAGAGNDTVVPRDGNDVVLAGGGADVVTDGPGRDLVLGGRGADELHGDRLLGGPGRDRLFGSDGWRAEIHARDGERDRVSCGSPRRDTVTADRFDRVARNCEFVRRK